MMIKLLTKVSQFRALCEMRKSFTMEEIKNNQVQILK